MLLPIFSINELSFNAPKLIFQGNFIVESIRIFNPHSPSIPINNGVLLRDCILLVVLAVFIGDPLDKITPPIECSCICL